MKMSDLENEGQDHKVLYIIRIGAIQWWITSINDIIMIFALALTFFEILIFQILYLDNLGRWHEEKRDLHTLCDCKRSKLYISVFICTLVSFFMLFASVLILFASWMAKTGNCGAGWKEWKQKLKTWQNQWKQIEYRHNTFIYKIY